MPAFWSIKKSIRYFHIFADIILLATLTLKSLMMLTCCLYEINRDINTSYIIKFYLKIKSTLTKELLKGMAVNIINFSSKYGLCILNSFLLQSKVFHWSENVYYYSYIIDFVHSVI